MRQLLIFSLLLLPVAGDCPVTDRCRGLFELGLQNLKAKNFDVGITLLETLTISFPDSVYVDSAKTALNECSHDPECAAFRTQIDVRPGGEGQTFFPSLTETDSSK